MGIYGIPPRNSSAEPNDQNPIMHLLAASSTIRSSCRSSERCSDMATVMPGCISSASRAREGAGGPLPRPFRAPVLPISVSTWLPIRPDRRQATMAAPEMRQVPGVQRSAGVFAGALLPVAPEAVNPLVGFRAGDG
jgi:hypothetical protein